MEGFGGPKFSSVTSVMKKKRSTKSRRARPDSQFIIERQDTSSLSSAPSSENRSSYAPKIASLSSIEGVSSSRRIRKEGKYGDYSGLYGSGEDTKRISESVLALPNWKSSSSGSVGGNSNIVGETKLKKVKLKVGGVTRTFRPKASTEVENSGYESKITSRKEPIIQEDSDDDSTPTVKGDLSPFEEQTSLLEPVRKSKRVPKRRVFDSELREINKVDESRNLEKLKFSKISTVNKNSDLETDVHISMKKKNISRASRSKRVPYTVDEDYNSSRTDNKRKSRSGKELNDLEYIDEDEEEIVLGDGLKSKRRKEKREQVEVTTEARIEPLTTRQRALQSGKGSSAGDSLIEFPDGLPPAPSRKQKEKLSEKEQQARKAEAAQRRRMQVEKANRESEAEAIRKILGQDSSRRKKEEKMRKERDELAQKKAAEALVLAPNSIRCVIGPARTIVTFGEDVDFLSIFSSKPASYPPPREKCAAPSCSNVYKYRDSKLNLPLCSLQCYKAVQRNSHSIST